MCTTKWSVTTELFKSNISQPYSSFLKSDRITHVVAQDILRLIKLLCLFLFNFIIIMKCIRLEFSDYHEIHTTTSTLVGNSILNCTKMVYWTQWFFMSGFFCMSLLFHCLINKCHWCLNLEAWDHLKKHTPGVFAELIAGVTCRLSTGLLIVTTWLADTSEVFSGRPGVTTGLSLLLFTWWLSATTWLSL